MKVDFGRVYGGGMKKGGKRARAATSFRHPPCIIISLGLQK